MIDQKNLPGFSRGDDPVQRAASVGAAEVPPHTLRLLAEELSVEPREIETGRVRVTTVTREREELVDVPLAREHVEVTHVPIGRTIETMPATRQDGETTIIPVVEEVLVIERRLMLKEELHIKRVRVTEQHQERVKLRRQEVVITRIPVGTPDVQAGSAPDTET